MAGGGGGEQDLNLVPYMDIMVNLIMFMLVVTAYLVELREAPVLAPAYNSGGSNASDEKPKAFLSVNIVQGGFRVIGSGATGIDKTIELAGGKYPLAELQAFLREAKDNPALELQPNLVIAADGAIPYKVIVQTMDAARKDASGVLFPGVTLGVAVK